MSDPVPERRTEPGARRQDSPRERWAGSEGRPERPRKRSASPAGAGALLVATTLLCAGVGLALGAAVGLAVPFGLVGFFAGLAVGFAVVYSRFKDI